MVSGVFMRDALTARCWSKNVITSGERQPVVELSKKLSRKNSSVFRVTLDASLNFTPVHHGGGGGRRKNASDKKFTYY